MPDRRTRRGPHPKDKECFAPGELPRLRRAVEDLSLLLTRGYSPKASLKLVGDRYSLQARQRKALQRCAAGDAECVARRERLLAPSELAGQTVIVDGYNVLLSVEAALCDGVLLVGRDGTIRDLAAMSGHYRRVHATLPAIGLLADFFADHDCARVRWLLDRPVSNSGRLRGLIEEAVAGRSPAWEVELTDRTDRALIDSRHVVASADSAVLDRCGWWINLVRELVAGSIPDAWVVDLSGAG